MNTCRSPVPCQVKMSLLPYDFAEFLQMTIVFISTCTLYSFRNGEIVP